MNKIIREDIIQDMRVRAVTRDEIARRVNCSDRTARYIISAIALEYPVISLSDGTGYRIATKREDVEDAVHAAKENAKRAREILKRNAQLDQFIQSQGA